MKLNNKGFAISGILYAVMILFLTIIISLLALMANRKLILDKYKKEVKSNLNSSSETYGARIQLAADTTHVRLTEEELAEYNFKSKVSGCIIGDNSLNDENTLCQENEKDITNLLNYKIYDEAGNEIVKFNYETIYSSTFSTDGLKAIFASYNYYDKDSKGNYLLDETKKNLKTVKKNLVSNKENMFYIRYYVVDNNNVLSKEATRTLVINKYNNYINVTKNHFKVEKENINTYNFKEGADSYKYESNQLIKDNDLLNYALYTSKDEAITNFYESGGSWYYVTKSGNTKIGSEESFRIRYFTGSIENPTSEISFAYFGVE